MRNRNRLWMLTGVLVALAIIMAGIYATTRPDTSAGDKTITVEVVYADETSNTFTYETDAAYLGEVLLENDLVEGEEGPYGLYITVVDGEEAVYEETGTYWALYEGDAYAQQSADQTPIEDGDVFALVNTPA